MALIDYQRYKALVYSIVMEIFMKKFIGLVFGFLIITMGCSAKEKYSEKDLKLGTYYRGIRG